MNKYFQNIKIKINKFIYDQKNHKSYKKSL